ncbi:type II toxin-antitoxin system RelE/ParE family toxin [uncultured Tolumonas sp.]|uniref:type II toxin-antitoxin system RelE/ParE family toxin n=1 Tax=uncultured Tolumonas sp. TaxID=263765 RepID=UPI00292FCCF4|nr:type II toxin-antitoxin system RelE/ParE family toxin [uncultured Tolumonas sp.]
MKITITDSAYEDLIDIKEHYKLEGVEHIREKHVDDVFNHIENLSEHPQMGRIVPEYGLPSLRELIHPPYRIVYLLKADEVQVIRVWRSERLLKLM